MGRSASQSFDFYNLLIEYSYLILRTKTKNPLSQLYVLQAEKSDASVTKFFLAACRISAFIGESLSAFFSLSLFHSIKISFIRFPKS
ncbi:hypothetical protein DLM78_23115 [Leptospira stimsonii]|uniref:Uncharacterized protein n=1 Tax=Leptospira stimsonii TaxID=2202203 RepID=A0A8B3CKD2_9LEPT|nr:hypothetical protein DLM78_23115 [Leptospira stimsonii]